TKPPGGESLKNTCERTTPYYKKYIMKNLQEGKTVLVSAHGNSLRAITMHVENISEQDIPTVEIPTGVPIVYTFDDQMKLTDKKFL
ncbi:2,3-bisphosphoglycerate-dependent phosphoglycerate mutase, partial [bacterium]|nr:2,3-bisphosphoglycerate-dependent phosphoglycerate mutase [bacterium]